MPSELGSESESDMDNHVSQLQVFDLLGLMKVGQRERGAKSCWVCTCAGVRSCYETKHQIRAHVVDMWKWATLRNWFLVSVHNAKSLLVESVLFQTLPTFDVSPISIMYIHHFASLSLHITVCIYVSGVRDKRAGDITGGDVRRGQGTRDVPEVVWACSGGDLRDRDAYQRAEPVIKIFNVW